MSGETYLLGPQRFLTTAGSVVRSLGVEGPVATVTAGWQDRELDDAELDGVLDGRSRNLRLLSRMTKVIERDDAVAVAALALRDAVDDLAGLYAVRLHHGLDAVHMVRRRKGRVDVVAAAVSDAIESVRHLDAWFLAEVRALYGEAYATGVLERSDLYAQHRAEVTQELAACSVLAVAGGHVGLLLRSLQFFDVQPPAALPVVAWSAGAMAMTDTVVLFNDRAQGAFGAEVWDRGLGRVPGVVALPHARRRLHLDDRARNQVLARRFAGSSLLLLDDGAKVQMPGGGALPTGARVIGPDGAITVVAAAA